MYVYINIDIGLTLLHLGDRDMHLVVDSLGQVARHRPVHDLVEVLRVGAQHLRTRCE